jgi:protein-disulfide isomerase
LARNLTLQRQLDLSGTPAWVVGDKVLVGAVGYDALKAAIAEARAKAKSR